ATRAVPPVHDDVPSSLPQRSRDFAAEPARGTRDQHGRAVSELLGGGQVWLGHDVLGLGGNGRGGEGAEDRPREGEQRCAAGATGGLHGDALRGAVPDGVVPILYFYVDGTFPRVLRTLFKG